LKVFNGYPANFRGLVGGQPVAGHLEVMASRCIEVLWKALTRISSQMASPVSFQERTLTFVYRLLNGFIDRPDHVSEIIKNILNGKTKFWFEI